MNRSTFELAEEMIQQADAAHQKAEATANARGPRHATVFALLALDWRLRALMLAWLDGERPIQVPSEEATP